MLTVVKAADGVVSCELADGAALLDMQSSTYFALNEVAAFVWTMIEQGCTVEAIRDAVVTSFDVAPPNCSEDLDALLGTLASKGLIQMANVAA